MTGPRMKKPPAVTHSPAPWLAKEGEIVAGDGEVVGVVYRTEAWSTGELVQHEDQANACLITAAPDMAAALAALVQTFQARPDMLALCGFQEHAQIKAACDALNKAGLKNGAAG